MPNFTQTFSWTWGLNYISSIDFVINQIKKENFDSLVDVGTGDGRLVRELSLNFKDKKITGIDYSEKAINMAKAMNPKLDFVYLDITRDDFGQRFDVLTLVEVFEHIPLDQCEKFVSSLKNLLNHNGVIFLTVPHKNKPLSEKHFQHFSFKSLKEYYEKDFEVVDVFFLEKKSKVVRILKKLLENRLFILNNKFLLNLIYRVYKKHFLFAKENNCGRMFLKLQKK
jgi:2-polyprenyl-3-methyl-5-hydroxy-6-metoxy-1,4-benzoquinol methylase